MLFSHRADNLRAWISTCDCCAVLEALLGSRKKAELSSRALLSVACESLHMMKDIAKGSDAVALLTLNLVADEVQRGEMVAIPAPEWVRANFGIVHLAHRSLSPLGETFVEFVKQADQELLHWEERTAKKLFASSKSKAVAKR